MDEVVISDGVLPNVIVNLPQCFSLLSFDPLLQEALLHYIVLIFQSHRPLVYYLTSYLSFCLLSHNFLIFGE